MKRVLLLAASIFILVACSGFEQSIPEEITSADGDLVEKVVFEVLPIKDEDGFETKASAVPDGGVVGFAWEATDTIGIYPDKGFQGYFSMENGAGTNSASFDGGSWALKKNSTYVSYYPFVADYYLDRDKIPVSFAGQKQIGTFSPFNGARYFLATEPTSSENGELRFSYETLNTIINVNATLPAGTYTKASLTVNEPLFVENGFYSLDDRIIVGTKFTNKLEIDLEDFTVATDGSTVPIYIMSAPVDLKGKEVVIKIVSEDGKWYICSKTPSKKYEAGTRYGLTCVMELDEESQLNSVIYYTSTDGEIVTPYATDVFGANITSNTYENGRGVITFDGDVTGIGQNAFSYCESLTSVTIPSSVTSIGDNAFNGCSSLESVTITSIIPPEIGENAFTNANNCPVFVPENVVEEYANEWPEYVNRIAFFVEPKVFPDENFCAFIFNNFDTNKDGLLSEAECDEVTSIDVDTESTSSLQGIEYFVNLEDLFCRLNNWSTLNKHFDPETHEWHMYDANDNEVIGSLSSLDVSSNTSLKRLYCIGNQLTSIDVSNNTALTVLNCSYNQIESLNVSNNVALTVLDCSYNQIESLNVSNNVALTFLSCSLNYVESLDVSNNTALTTFYCDYNQLGSIDVSNNSALTAFSCRSTQLETIDVSNNTSLSRFWCDYNQLTSLDISNNVSLTQLYSDNNQLTSLDVSNNVLLTQLYCDNNQLTSLDVSNNTLLATLYCRNSTMQYLYLAEGQKINRLYKNAATEIVYKGTEP